MELRAPARLVDAVLLKSAGVPIDLDGWRKYPPPSRRVMHVFGFFSAESLMFNSYFTSSMFYLLIITFQKSLDVHVLDFG